MCLAASFQVTQDLPCMKRRAVKIKLADPRRLLDDIVRSKESPVRLIHGSIVYCVQSSIRRKRFYKYQIDSCFICCSCIGKKNQKNDRLQTRMLNACGLHVYTARSYPLLVLIYNFVFQKPRSRVFYKWLRLLAKKELKLDLRLDTDPPNRVQNSNLMLGGIGEYDVLR